MENKYKNLRILISGTVQGVGFRPFIYRIANESNRYGYIQNKADGIVEICVQGKQRNIDLFINANNIFNTKYVDLGNIPQPGFWLSGGAAIKL